MKYIVKPGDEIVFQYTTSGVQGGIYEVLLVKKETGQLCSGCQSFCTERSAIYSDGRPFKGQCRAHPPTSDEGFPEVWSTDWCLEYKGSNEN